MSSVSAARRAAQFRGRYGPWAVVAGASEGLGAEFAEQLAARGLNLVLVARRGERLRELCHVLAARHGIDVRALVLDVADADLQQRLAEQVAELQVGLLVYNAAFSVIGPFLDQPVDNHLRTIAVNCRGPVVLAHLLGTQMVQRGRGGIVLMSSLSALQGSPIVASYAATKAYNLILAESLWDELAEHGVDVLACCAGATRTPAYLATKPRRGGWLSAPEGEPGAVVRAALAALGRRPSIIPGWLNRIAAFLMQRLLPRRLAARIMGRATRAMYGSRS